MKLLIGRSYILRHPEDSHQPLGEVHKDDWHKVGNNTMILGLGLGSCHGAIVLVHILKYGEIHELRYVLDFGAKDTIRSMCVIKLKRTYPPSAATLATNSDRTRSW